MPWNPDHYLAFGDLRLRPAVDLLARVPVEDATTVADLGCGPGNVTRILQARWPRAAVTGVDNSAEMLARAAAAVVPGVAWQQADVATWAPEAPVDVLFSNAALHWLDHHETLFPRLAGFVRPGGALAVQMPDNFAAPSHRCACQAAREGPWRAVLEPLLRSAPVRGAGNYHDLLVARARSLDIWETEYLQVLEGDNPVADWTRGSLLVPLLAALEEPWRSAFEADYRRRVAAAYPRHADGRTLFPFRRLFIVAVMG
ncbi:MAG: methyltransferase domain-containing protein [Betaproteobacteria bacterium]|nr:methyltransferase domain-containing protein [Betaproteobacteria bacterium]